MKSQQWYNNDQPNKYLDGFINDKSNRTYVRMENWILHVKMISKKRIQRYWQKYFNIMKVMLINFVVVYQKLKIIFRYYINFNGSMFIEIEKLFHVKHDFWFVINFEIIICSWMGLIVYIVEGKQLSRIGQLFSQTHDNFYLLIWKRLFLRTF